MYCFDLFSLSAACYVNVPTGVTKFHVHIRQKATCASTRLFTKM